MASGPQGFGTPLPLPEKTIVASKATSTLPTKEKNSEKVNSKKRTKRSAPTVKRQPSTPEKKEKKKKKQTLKRVRKIGLPWN